MTGHSSTDTAGGRRGLVIAAFIAIYIIWGSTYLGIRFAIETIPPFTLSAVRFVMAGLIMFAIAKARGEARATLPQWRTGAIVGSLLMLANALVGVAEKRIPSGVAALLVAMTPLFMVLLEWGRPGGRRPTVLVAVGLLIGLAGVAALVGPASFGDGARIDLIGAATVIVGSLAWSAGSIYSRHAPRPESSLMMTAMQMTVGGAFVGVLAVVTGEVATFDPSAVSARSALAFLYLLVFGSLIGFSAFVYLLRVSTPARVATYAYVNPAVAVLLGWLLAGELISGRMLVAAAIIIAGVALITVAEGRMPSPPQPRRGSLPRHTGEYPVTDRA
ncbi:MAG TPA: EamA family transporter [Gemmatimonadaceae bacterium]|jgi:drug/metabolite transporter (DMT)-like permease|nr:EamA family transporter [Gemmatimonadaceae bacterium]